MDTFLLYKLITNKNLPLEEALSCISHIHTAYADTLITDDSAKSDTTSGT